MKRLLLIGIIVLLLLGVFIFIIVTTSKQRHPFSGQLDKLVVGKEVEYGTLFSIAQDQGYFIQNGLDVTLKEYATGAPAVADLLKGTIDMADAAEFVGVRNSFSGDNFKIIASIGTTSDAWEIVARRDHGIKMPSDLQGKKIGVPAGTLGEFYLGNFLTLNQISSKDIQLIYLSPKDLSEALLNGSIDGIMIFQPYAFDLNQNLGKRSIRFLGQSDRPNYIMLYATNAVVKNRPDVVKRFVESLVEAQDYLENNPGELKHFMKKHFGYSDLYIASVISHFKFYVALDQQTLPIMEDEANWAIANSLTDAQRMPDYLNFIYFDALNSVKPEAITIIR